MFKYLAWKLAGSIPVILLVSIGVFLLMHLIPGDPVVTMLGDQATPENIARLRGHLGLDQPLHIQYIRWAGGIIRGDMGRAITNNQPIGGLISAALPTTVELALLSLLFGLVVGLSVGIASAVRPGSVLDAVVSTFSMLGVSMPVFWLGLILMYLFAMRLGWLPAIGFVPFFEDPVKSLRYMVLPTIVLGARVAGVIMRQVRSSLLNVLNDDYVRVARAKGLAEPTVILRHALKNALIPVTTVLGLQVAALLGGAVITETIFAIPGLGRLVIGAILARDFPIVQGVVLVMAVAVVLTNIAVDVFYAYLDPRIKYS